MGGLVNMGPRTADSSLHLFPLGIWVKKIGCIGDGIYIAPEVSQGHAAICRQRQHPLRKGPLLPLVSAVYEQRSSVYFPEREKHQQLLESISVATCYPRTISIRFERFERWIVLYILFCVHLRIQYATDTARNCAAASLSASTFTCKR